MDHEFTCAWERMHRIRLSELPAELQWRMMIDRRKHGGSLDLDASLEPFRRSAA